MRPTFLLILLLSGCFVSAQLSISAGAQFSVSGNVQLTLQNTDLVNNGSFISGNSMISFTGNASSSISGSQPVQFNEMGMNKTNNASVLLQRPVGVAQRILFTSGFLDLNGFNADLGSTGHLEGEQENSRIKGISGGQVLFSTSLNAPVSADPGNLGAIISSSQNLGNVIIKRGHQSQVNGSGLGNSIFRYYDIVPVNNTNLNATLRFKYFDGELNSLNENSIEFFKSLNNINWADVGFTSRDIVANFTEKTGIGSFARFTLSGFGNPLPVNFILFNTKCENSKVLLNWKTAEEYNSHHFNIERSTDGVIWTIIGSQPAAGNSSIERSYSFTDNIPAQNSFYRIAEYDLDGRVQYTGILRSSCNTTDRFSPWPNPAHEKVFINIVTDKGSQVMIKIFDSKGALVKMQSATILRGSNQLSVDIRSLANGIYPLTVEWENGLMKKTVQVVKQ